MRSLRDHHHEDNFIDIKRSYFYSSFNVDEYEYLLRTKKFFKPEWWEERTEKVKQLRQEAKKLLEEFYRLAELLQEEGRIHFNLNELDDLLNHCNFEPVYNDAERAIVEEGFKKLEELYRKKHGKMVDVIALFIIFLFFVFIDYNSLF